MDAPAPERPTAPQRWLADLAAVCNPAVVAASLLFLDWVVLGIAALGSLVLVLRLKRLSRRAFRVLAAGLAVGYLAATVVLAPFGPTPWALSALALAIAAVFPGPADLTTRARRILRGLTAAAAALAVVAVALIAAARA